MSQVVGALVGGAHGLERRGPRAAARHCSNAVSVISPPSRSGGVTGLSFAGRPDASRHSRRSWASGASSRTVRGCGLCRRVFGAWTISVRSSPRAPTAVRGAPGGAGRRKRGSRSSLRHALGATAGRDGCSGRLVPLRPADPLDGLRVRAVGPPRLGGRGLADEPLWVDGSGRPRGLAGGSRRGGSALCGCLDGRAGGELVGLPAADDLGGEFSERVAAERGGRGGRRRDGRTPAVLGASVARGSGSRSFRRTDRGSRCRCRRGERAGLFGVIDFEVVALGVAFEPECLRALPACGSIQRTSHRPGACLLDAHRDLRSLRRPTRLPRPRGSVACAPFPTSRSAYPRPSAPDRLDRHAHARRQGRVAVM